MQIIEAIVTYEPIILFFIALFILVLLSKEREMQLQDRPNRIICRYSRSDCPFAKECE